MNRKIAFILLLIAMLILTACGNQDQPAQAVVRYFEAMVAKDSALAVNLSCAEWESQATLDVDALEAVDARLEEFVCESTGTEGDYTLVNCTGSMILTYDGEDRPLDLSVQTFKAVQEGGEWLMCGY